MVESIKQEINKLKTDKIIIIIALIMPIMINLIVGWELKKGVMSNIPLVVVDYDNSQLSRQIVQYFSDSETFDLKYEIDNQEMAQKLLDTSQVKVGMIIPKHFSSDVVGLKSPSILMLYDGSHMSITSVAKAKASEILLTIRAGASIKQLQGRLNMTEEEAYHTAMPISFETRTLYNPARNFNYFMTPGYGTIICQTGIGLTAILCICATQITNKKTIVGYILGKIIFYGGLGSLAFISNILVQISLFRIPFRGSLLVAITLSILLALAIASLAVVVSAWISNRVFAIAMIGLLLIPNSVMSGYTWPVISMLPFYQKTAPIIPFSHYGEHIRNLFLKGSIQNVGQDIFFLIVFIITMTLLASAKLYIACENRTKEAFSNELTV